VLNGLVLPPAAIEESRVHAVEVRREQRRFVSASTRPYLDNSRAIVERIGWNEQRLELALDFRLRLFHPCDFRTRFGCQLGVVNDNELARLRELVIEFFQSVGQRDDVGEPLVLSSERREQPCVADGLGIDQLALDLRRARERVGESIADAQVLVPYFCRKRSTRPAVSISFCLPVKNGWQLEQMSVLMFATVERVVNALPHAQCTLAV
jgi:hypothetical protein